MGLLGTLRITCLHKPPWNEHPGVLNTSSASHQNLALQTLGLRTAHTLHNLGNIVSVLQFLQVEVSAQLTNRQNATLLAALDFLQHLVRFHLESLQSHPQNSVFSIEEVLCEVRALLFHTPNWKRTELSLECPKTWTLWGPPIVFEQIIVNVLSNAAAATRAAAKPKVQLQVHHTKYATIITVLDNGGGAPAQSLPFLGTLFQSSKRQPGHGLGLHFVRQALKESFGGHCHFHNTPQGLAVELSFPHRSG